MIDYTEGSGLQYHVGLGPGMVGQYVLLPGDPKRCEKIAAYFEEPQLMADSREYVTYTGLLDGVKVSVTSTGIGGPSASIAMEELTRCGAHTFVRVGTCGGMQLPVVGGDLVIATGAIRMEGHQQGVSPHRVPRRRQHRHHHCAAAGRKGAGHDQPHRHCPVQGQLLRPGTAPSGCRSAMSWRTSGRHGSAAARWAVRWRPRRSTPSVRCWGVRAGAVMLCVWNQEREKAGLDQQECHDTTGAIRTAIRAGGDPRGEIMLCEGSTRRTGGGYRKKRLTEQKERAAFGCPLLSFCTCHQSKETHPANRPPGQNGEDKP